MGVDLGDLIPRKKVQLSEFRNQRIAIDAYNTLYQFLAIIRGASGEHLRDSKGRVTSHLSGLFYRNVNLMEMNIKLAYVFDGVPPELKTKEIENRRKQRQDARQQYHRALESGDLPAARKYAEASTSLGEDMVADSKKLLQAMGIPTIDAPSEGEAQASLMAAEGTFDAVGSQDHDSLLFGAPILDRNITVSGRRRLPSKNIFIDVEPETIALSETLQTLGLTREQLVDLGILLGTDFNPEGFRGIGPVKALKLLKSRGSLERIVELEEPLSQIDYPAIRKLFLSPPAKVGVKVSWGTFDADAVRSYLVDEHSFSRERVDAAIKRITHAESSKTETLERWFG